VIRHVDLKSDEAMMYSKAYMEFPNVQCKYMLPLKAVKHHVLIGKTIYFVAFSDSASDMDEIQIHNYDT
jgi:hypothetical protein